MFVFLDNFLEHFARLVNKYPDLEVKEVDGLAHIIIVVLYHVALGHLEITLVNVELVEHDY